MRQAQLLLIKDLKGPHFGPISLSLSAGERLAILGPSGGGKTLFLRAVADLDPNEGAVELNALSREAFAPEQWRRRVALLPAEPGWWGATVKEHFPEGEDIPVAEVGLHERALTWSVARLSSGERQRLALLRTLANRPEVLLLDEPTANLDPMSRRQVEALVRRYCDEHGAGALWVTHDLEQAGRVADRMFRLEGGRLQEISKEHGHDQHRRS